MLLFSNGRGGFGRQLLDINVVGSETGVYQLIDRHTQNTSFVRRDYFLANIGNEVGYGATNFILINTPPRFTLLHKMPP